MEVVPTAVPKDFGLKLCLLGRAFSGKKTISKQIQGIFGDKNIRVFDMDEIVKEALDYINPKKPEPVPEKPVKGKRPNKQEEVVVTDPFEGKNTVEYKEVAN